MMRIERLSAQPDRAGRFRVELEDGTVLRLYRQTVADFGLYSGMELDAETFARLRTAAGEMSAKMRAVRIVSATAVSKDDLQQRLIQKGEAPEQAKAAVAWMEELDLLDDRKTAEQVVAHCVSRGYGLARAKQALYEKRIPKQLWEDALADYPDQEEEILSFLRSRLKDSTDKAEVRRVTQALLRRGHSYTQIKKCMDRLSLNFEEFPEE